MVEMDEVVIKLLPSMTLPLLLTLEGSEEEDPDVIWLLSEMEPEYDALPDIILEPALTDKLDSLCEDTDAEPLTTLEAPVTVPVSIDEAA